MSRHATPATPHHHGNSVAAWSTVAIVIAGFALSGTAVILGSAVLFWLGVLLGAVGVGVGKLLSMAGFGSLPSYEVQEPEVTALEGPTRETPEARAAAAEADLQRADRT